MINLLTKEGQVNLLREYRRRRVAVGGFLLLILCLVALTLTGNLIYRIKSRQTETKAALARLSLKSETDAEVKAVLQATNLDVAALKRPDRARPDLVAWWQLVVKARPAGLKLTDWLWESGTKDKPSALSLSGRAGSRQVLLNFIERLKKESAFTAVNSPISNLIKSGDFDFTIQLTLNANEK